MEGDAAAQRPSAAAITAAAMSAMHAVPAGRPTLSVHPIHRRRFGTMSRVSRALA